MTTGPQLYRINSENQESRRLQEVDFGRLGLRERRDIQEWIATNPGILGDDLLIIGKEFSEFDRTNERLDLLAVDAYGRLVIIELKRDDTGTNAHWQAIKYASYLSDASQEDIVGMLARYEKVTAEDAISKLAQHLGADDLNALNNDQRIILASHRFAPEVTSAVLWLNEKATGDELITCVQLTPHHDVESDSLYIQVNTIIPVPGTEDLSINLGDEQDSVGGSGGQRGTFAQNLRKTRAESVRHSATPFMRGVADIVLKNLDAQLRPTRKSQHAGKGGDHRYYHLWYWQRPPWGNWTTSYRVNLYEGDEPPWRADVYFATDIGELRDRLKEQGVRSSISLERESLNESFANELASNLTTLIESITPIVDEFENEINEEPA